MTKPADFYVLECEATGCDAEFWLNDIPVVRRGPTHGLYLSAPVNHLVRDGENVLTAVIRSGPIPSQSKTGVPDAPEMHVAEEERVWAKVSAYPRGAVAGGPDGQHLIQLDWPPIPRLPTVHPLVLSAREDLGKLRGAWAWETAPELTLDDATKKEIFDYLTALRALLNDGDCDAFLTKQKLRLADIARAFDMRPSQKMNQIRRIFADEFGQPNWVFDPLDEGSFDLRLVADGRMVECIGKDWEPIVRQAPDADGNVGAWDVMLAKIDGAWQIVR